MSTEHATDSLTTFPSKTGYGPPPTEHRATLSVGSFALSDS